jgi:tetratricopeptide (TPR) repeat protein
MEIDQDPGVKPRQDKASLLERLRREGQTPAPQESIRSVAVNRQILQDFRPIAQSLEWEISDLYWAKQGVAPFVRSEVPFIINNNGRLSEDAAVLLFANCLETQTTNGPIRVLELGAGTGLFARYFLNSFRDICRQENHDFYDRLTYFISDRSPRACEQWLENGLFSEHTAHVVVGTCTGDRPTEFEALRGEIAALTPLQAVFTNYVLDVMPAAIVKVGATGPEQLCIRTLLTDNEAAISQCAGLTLPEVQRIAKSEDPAERDKLLTILSVLEFEAQFIPVSEDQIPYLAEILEFGKNQERNLLNYGALQCLQGCLNALAAGGFVLINDYGPTERDYASGHAITQRFGSSLALGLNFPFLEHHLVKSGYLWFAPEDNERGIHARMVYRRELPRTGEMLLKRFSSESLKFFESPIEAAVRHQAAGRNDQALEYYRQALERNPHNWHLIGQAAEFVSLQLRNFDAGLQLIRSALEQNPCYSTWLWNVLGDCLFCLERFSEAHEAYQESYAINPDDARTNFNLSYTLSQMGRYDESLRVIAHALANDPQAIYRERLLNKQQQILASISAAEISDRDRLLKRAAVLS